MFFLTTSACLDVCQSLKNDLWKGAQRLANAPDAKFLLVPILDHSGEMSERKQNFLTDSYCTTKKFTFSDSFKTIYWLVHLASFTTLSRLWGCFVTQAAVTPVTATWTELSSAGTWSSKNASALASWGLCGFNVKKNVQRYCHNWCTCRDNIFCDDIYVNWS